MKTDLLRFSGAIERDPAIDAWLKTKTKIKIKTKTKTKTKTKIKMKTKDHAGELGAIAREWFEVMRKCGDEVHELLHDGRTQQGRAHPP